MRAPSWVNSAGLALVFVCIQSLQKMLLMAEAQFISLNLQPVMLAPGDVHRRGLRRVNRTLDDNGVVHSRGVYASIPDSADPRFGDDANLQEFHRWRHFSRFERALQETKSDSLVWNGTHYPFPPQAKQEKDSSIIGDWREKLNSVHRKLLQRNFDGGQLNRYQAVPLSQGYGTHYVSVWVGGPTPQRKTVIIDTGE